MPGALPPLTGRLVDAIMEARKKQIDEEIMALTSNPSYCCGNDTKCAGGCACQCHSMKAEIERLQRELTVTTNSRNSLIRGTVELTAERDRLRAALRGAVAYITMDSEHPPMLEAWRKLALGDADETTDA